MRVRLLSVVAGVVLLTGCGQVGQGPTASPTPGPASSPAAAPTVAPSPTPTPTPTPTPSPTPTETVTRVVVTLTKGKADPNGDRIELARGETVEFVVTSDHDDELHIHGMEIGIPVEAGETVVEQVTVDRTGRFEVESHHPALVIVQLVVR